jgi:hypothetical protein
MFFKRKLDLRMINPSSKISLKMSCLASCKGDIEQATKLYNFLADGIESIPDFDVAPISTFDQIKQGAGQLFGWIKQNKQELIDGYNFVQSLRGNSPIASQSSEQNIVPQDIPPLPTDDDTSKN